MRSKVSDEGIPADRWTTSLQDVPALTHAIVEDFVRQTNDKRHVTEGYAFSKTKKFETSGKPITLNLLPDHDMFLLEGTHQASYEARQKYFQGERNLLLFPFTQQGDWKNYCR